MWSDGDGWGPAGQCGAVRAAMGALISASTDLADRRSTPGHRRPVPGMPPAGSRSGAGGPLERAGRGCWEPRRCGRGRKGGCQLPRLIAVTCWSRGVARPACRCAGRQPQVEEAAGEQPGGRAGRQDEVAALPAGGPSAPRGAQSDRAAPCAPTPSGRAARKRPGGLARNDICAPGARKITGSWRKLAVWRARTARRPHLWSGR